MKKLMTIFASAATLCAVGVAKGELTTTGFEEDGASPAYIAGQSLNTAKDDAGLVDGDGAFAATWLDIEPLEDGVAVISNWNGETLPVNYDKEIGDQYLKLEGAPLITRYAQADGEAVEIGDGLYIDTLVQFSAAEDVQASGGDDKLCIWLKENEEDPTQCTLMITAGFVDSDDGYTIVATNYETTTKLANNSWHRLQVKVLAGIDSEDTDMLGDGFVVLIDGTVVETATCPINSEFISEYVLNARANEYMKTAGSYKLFPSLINKDTDSGTITSLSFSGSGAVDNLSFSQAADIDPIFVTIPTAKLGLVADGTPKTGVTYDEDLEGTAFELDGDGPTQTAADTYTTTFKLFAGYAWIGGSTADYDVEWSISSGSGTGGFDGGESGKTFSIDSATQTALEAVLGGKALTDVADAASGMTYAQAYALGLLDDKTGDVDALEATIEVVNGKVKVSLDVTSTYKVTLKIYEKASLTAEWPAEAKTSYELGSEEEAAGFTPGSATAGFYKVAIVIENAD